LKNPSRTVYLSRERSYSNHPRNRPDNRNHHRHYRLYRRKDNIRRGGEACDTSDSARPGDDERRRTDRTEVSTDNDRSVSRDACDNGERKPRRFRRNARRTGRTSCKPADGLVCE